MDCNNSTLYNADLGTWERGKNVDLPGATNLKEALELAEKLLEEIEWDARKLNFKEPFVVQIRKGQIIVWDYFNGSYCY